MPLPVTRVQMRERIRRDKQLRGNAPSDDDLDSFAHEAIAWWWRQLANFAPNGVGRRVEEIVATPGQGYVVLPDDMRLVRHVARSDSVEPVEWTTADAVPLRTLTEDVTTPLPGLAWLEYRAGDGQVVELRPTPTTALTVTVRGTGAPPAKWADDAATIDLIDEAHWRAVIAVASARLMYRDDQIRLQKEEALAAQEVEQAMTVATADIPSNWQRYARRP